MLVALIFDKDCRLGSDDPGYKGGHFRFKDNSDPNQPTSRKPDRHKPSRDSESLWAAVGIGAIVESPKQPAFSESDDESDTGAVHGEGSSLRGNYYQVLAELDDEPLN